MKRDSEFKELYEQNAIEILHTLYIFGQVTIEEIDAIQHLLDRRKLKENETNTRTN